LPEVSWLFFKAVRAGLAVKGPYLNHRSALHLAHRFKQPAGESQPVKQPKEEGRTEPTPTRGLPRPEDIL